MDNQEVEKKMMSIVAEDGSIEEVEVILAFEFKDTNKEYVIYTKNEKDENDNVTVYVSHVDRSSGDPGRPVLCRVLCVYNGVRQTI